MPDDSIGLLHVIGRRVLFSTLCNGALVSIFVLSFARLHVASMLLVLARVAAHDFSPVVVLRCHVRHELLVDERSLLHAVGYLGCQRLIYHSVVV